MACSSREHSRMALVRQQLEARAGRDAGAYTAGFAAEGAQQYPATESMQRWMCRPDGTRRIADNDCQFRMGRSNCILRNNSSSCSNIVRWFNSKNGLQAAEGQAQAAGASGQGERNPPAAESAVPTCTSM